MKRNNIFFKVFNEESILIQWNDQVNLKLIETIISYQKLIEQELSEVLIECVQSINSMMVIYDPNKINSEDLVNNLQKLNSIDVKVLKSEKKIWKIPVCYDLSFGIDLEDMSTLNSISIDEIIKIHSSTTYSVLSMGFLPGFLYLGVNDNQLHHWIDITKENPSKEKVDYREQYNTESVEIVQSIYQQDFEYFNYSYDLADSSSG